MAAPDARPVDDVPLPPDPRPEWRVMVDELRGRFRRRMRPPRRLKFTTAGKWYTAITIMLGLAAINTGNNLLFLLLGLLLSGIVLSGVISEGTLQRIEVRRVLPEEATAGRPALVGVEVTNGKPRQPSFALVLRDVTATGQAGTSFVLRLGPGETRQLSYRWVPEKRGRVVFTGLEIATRFPFGLFEKWREVDAVEECVVLPRQVPGHELTVRKSAPIGERPANEAGPGSEFFALRDARERDDARNIHWRTSARRGRPVIVERERERRRRVVVSLDNRSRTLSGAESIDGAVELAASAVRRAVAQGNEVGVVASGVLVAPGSGVNHERRVLRALALLSPLAEGPAPRRVAGAETIEVPLETKATPPESDARAPGAAA